VPSKPNIGGRSATRSTGRESSSEKTLWFAKIVFEMLAKSLIEQGIPTQLAERLLRAAYVRETIQGVRRGWGNGPNASQISIRTGLDRHLVGAILRNGSEALNVPPGRRDPITRVVDGWLSDPEYSTRKVPRDLPVQAVAKGRSVHSLLRRYAPGVSPRLMLEELSRMNLVVKLPDGKLRIAKEGRDVLAPVRSERNRSGSADLGRALGVLMEKYLGRSRSEPAE
jgi:hypothetical protein